MLQSGTARVPLQPSVALLHHCTQDLSRARGPWQNLALVIARTARDCRCSSSLTTPRLT